MRRARFTALASGGLLAAALLCWVRARYLVTEVEGQSMEPALHPGDRLLVRRTKRLRRGQIAVLQFPARGSAKQLLVKRVVAVPGDRVSGAWRGPGLRDLSGTAVPLDCVVVLGDNRPVSWDSRHYGFVTSDRLVGAVRRRLSGPAGPQTATITKVLPSGSAMMACVPQAVASGSCSKRTPASRSRA